MGHVQTRWPTEGREALACSPHITECVGIKALPSGKPSVYNFDKLLSVLSQCTSACDVPRDGADLFSVVRIAPCEWLVHAGARTWPSWGIRGPLGALPLQTGLPGSSTGAGEPRGSRTSFRSPGCASVVREQDPGGSKTNKQRRWSWVQGAPRAPCGGPPPQPGVTRESRWGGMATWAHVGCRLRSARVQSSTREKQPRGLGRDRECLWASVCSPAKPGEKGGYPPQGSGVCTASLPEHRAP